MMRIGHSADATPFACWWLEEIDGLVTSPRRKGSNLSRRIQGLALDD